MQMNRRKEDKMKVKIGAYKGLILTQDSFLVLSRGGPYFVKEHSDSKSKYTEDDIINMLEFIVDNIFVVFGGKVFQQIVYIPMGTNCAPLQPTYFCTHTKRGTICSYWNTDYLLENLSHKNHENVTSYSPL